MRFLILALLLTFSLPAFAQPDNCECPPSKSRSSKSGTWATISVDSEPRGAEVYVDFEYQGTTPLQNVQVHAGNVPLTLVKDGYQRQTSRLSLKPGEAKSLGVIPLGSSFGEITLRSYPARASVILDGDKLSARTPLIIRKVPRDKPHTVELQMDGFNSWQRVITLDDKDKKKFDVELERKP